MSPARSRSKSSGSCSLRSSLSPSPLRVGLFSYTGPVSADSEEPGKKPPRKLTKLTKHLFESPTSHAVDLEARKALLRKQQEEMQKEVGQKSKG